jgi:hypothetical protein
MLKVEHIEVFGWEAAIRGMRNPLNSWDKSDSRYDDYGNFLIGENDLALMLKLAKAGSSHAKYRRMINVTLDIIAPLYWWKEYDTYKVGTVANSCSTMHKIHAKEFELDDFSHEHLMSGSMWLLHRTVDLLNEAREAYLDCTVSHYPTSEECKVAKKAYWWQMIQLLPTSYNQRRTVQLNYEVLVGMYRDRRNHKLDEWHTLCDAIERLPYSEMITGGSEG